MKRPRIIPVLLLRNRGLVKSVKFKNHIYVGDPINAVRIYNDLRVDELIVLDIDATAEKRPISVELINQIGEEANMPFSVGGGITDVHTIKNLIQAGAERVVLSSYALTNPTFIEEASDWFGASTIVVCVDYKRSFLGGNQVFVQGGSKKVGLTPLEAAKLAESQGAGEVVLQSIDNDGLMTGFDTEMIRQVNRELTIPVVALGGAGHLSDFEDLYAATPVNAIASGSFFVFQGKHRGVLIRYPDPAEYNFK
ncbi:MAG: AglZ/HisF2 family acetamidino modification protein [Pyrinomonadaceae bacterium]